MTLARVLTEEEAAAAVPAVREQLRLKGKVIWNGAGSTATTSGRLNAPFPEECAPLKESITAGLRRGGLLEGRRLPKLSVLGGVGDGQETHVDYPPAAVAQAPVKPASAVVALEPGTRIFLGDERKLYDIPVGWACVFEGDVPHAGAGYTVQSARVHGYLEVESVRKPVDAVFDPPARRQVPPSAAEEEAAERAAAAADSTAAAAADVAEVARELLALQAGGGAAPANGAEQGASTAPPAAQRALEQRLIEAVARVEDGQRDAAAMAAKLAALERSLAASQQTLSLAAFKTNPHLRSRFSEYAWFATIEEFELFFTTLSKFCPLEEMQYYKGPKSMHSGKLRSVSVSSTGKTRGRKHNLDYIDQFLFTMVQLAAVPDRSVLAGFFAINNSDATKYFSTWVLLLEDFLLSAMPVSSDLERRLRAKLPEPFRKQFKNRPVVCTVDCEHLPVEAPTDEFARSVLATPRRPVMIALLLTPSPCYSTGRLYIATTGASVAARCCTRSPCSARSFLPLVATRGRSPTRASPQSGSRRTWAPSRASRTSRPPPR